MKVKTKSGFECDIPNGIAQDFRFLRARKDVKSDDLEKAERAALDMISILFCDEKEEERFLLHLADENGRIPVDAVYREFWEIVGLVAAKDKKVKNS